MYSRLASHARSSRNTDLRLGVVSGSSCPAEVAALVRQRMGITLLERYGMTEVSPLTWREHLPAAAPGDVGRPGWGVRIRAVGTDGKVLAAGKEGELEVRAPGMMLGYLEGAATAAAMPEGWLRTGDLGAVRADGGITLSGRLKDVILRGGYTISARQVESAILRHPSVAEVAVVGLAHPELGEEIAAVVVLKPRRPATEEDLRGVVALNLATYKRPRLWRIVEEMPRTSLGKVRRDRLRELFTPAEEPGETP
jgi:long-chain acyl-CoA synthetase